MAKANSSYATLWLSEPWNSLGCLNTANVYEDALIAGTLQNRYVRIAVMEGHSFFQDRAYFAIVRAGKMVEFLFAEFGQDRLQSCHHPCLAHETWFNLHKLIPPSPFQRWPHCFDFKKNKQGQSITFFYLLGLSIDELGGRNNSVHRSSWNSSLTLRLRCALWLSITTTDPDILNLSAIS